MFGFPVAWDEIPGARVIVEGGFRDFRMTPSQGSHFFSKPHCIPGWIFHGQSRSRQGFRGLEVVVGAILRGRALLRAASALQRSIRADEWAIQPRDDFQA
jgi:hypothetical protein